MIEWAREDFIRKEEGEEYECLLLNKDWTVQPTITVSENYGAQVVTCRSHDGGTTNSYLHLPRQPEHILPAAMSDQLAHVSIKTRMIRQKKAKKYCTTFQMVEQRGCFQGIDTCDATIIKNFKVKRFLYNH